MNNERIKTDALSDAVEIPEGATHIDKHGDYWKVVNKNEAHFMFNGRWIRYAFTDHMHHVSIGDIVKL